MRSTLALILALLASACWAQSVAFNGSLGAQAALLLINGEPHTLSVGQTVAGVRLVALDEQGATVEINGQRQTLVFGATPGRIENKPAANLNESIVLASGPGGHYIASGSINGQTTQFLIDTGSTAVAISQSEAERMGLHFLDGRRIMTQTANGKVPAHMITLDSVRIGDVEVHNVDAIVIPGELDQVLLGNTFLSRFQMHRDDDVMTLELRY